MMHRATSTERNVDSDDDDDDDDDASDYDATDDDASHASRFDVLLHPTEHSIMACSEHAN